MKIAFVYGPMSLGARPLDFGRLYDDPRGLTGSELSCVEYARAMGRRGHDVTLIVCQPEAPSLVWYEPRDHVDLPVHVELGSSKLARLASSEWDAICVWNEPDILRGASQKAVRLVNQQLNDFAYCNRGWWDYVDVLTSPSQHHLDYLDTFWLANGDCPPRCEVLPNGCDPTLYEEGHRVSGRVLWASSPDRGLHLLLQAWPLIRARVPHATLHCLYNFAPGVLLGYEEGSIGLNGLPVTPDIQELARRYRYIGYAMKRLEGMGVVQVGSVSRRGVVKEMNEAICLAYPCDTIRYTEGFSVTTMEACAAGLVPVASTEDALGSIYGSLPSLVKSPVTEHLDVFVEKVVSAIDGENPTFAKQTQAVGRALAAAHAWPLLAERLEGILASEMEKKRGAEIPCLPLRLNPLRVRVFPPPWDVPTEDVDSGAPIGLCLWGSGASHEVSEAIKKSQTERGPYEVEGNPAPEGARVAEWYVNHRGYGHTIMRYWATDDIMIGGSIYDATEWEYLQRRYSLTHVLNVENQNSDRQKKISSLYENDKRRDDDGTPRDVGDMMEIARWGRQAKRYGQPWNPVTRQHQDPKFYVHCTHGGSRSPAYAYLLIRARDASFDREGALALIRRTRPEYGDPQFPQHLTYLQNADEALMLLSREDEILRILTPGDKDAYDWRAALEFSEKGAPPVPGASCSGEGFEIHDIAEVLAKSDGDNDGPNWLLTARLVDGRFVFLSAGCGYTGWDCQSWGDAVSADTLDQLVQFGLDEEARERLGYKLVPRADLEETAT